MKQLSSLRLLSAAASTTLKTIHTAEAYMAVDNFDIIKPLLKFSDHQDFYFLQILLRKKDGNDCPAGSDN